MGDVHFNTYYSRGTPHPENQVTPPSDPLRGLKIQNGPGGTFLPISFDGGLEVKNLMNRSCSGGCFTYENMGGGLSDLLFGGKKGVFGGLLAAILKLYRGSVAFSRQMVSLQAAVRGLSDGQIFQITR